MDIKYPLDNLIPEIVSEQNLYASIDYVIDHLECKHQRDRFRPDKTLDDSDPEIKERWERYYAWRKRVYGILKVPFETTIQSEIFDGNKVKYKFT